MRKFVISIVTIAMCVTLLAGCSGGNAEIKRPAPSPGAKTFTVEGECAATLEDGILTVSGTTNLMDGTNGMVKVMNSDGTTLAKEKFTKQGDAISYGFPVAEDWPERVYGFITFDTQQADKQPAEVTDAYGKKFENLEGEDIIWDIKGVIALFQSELVEIEK